ncbi:hypothetical protein B5M44_22655 [Shinella sumterensis]|jgi:hypothetical protein|uniref:hypothetical protein n=1 Tax=Shinella sumterensis TaxID=1967501 RepID=UPI00106DEE42|nr:hypothetical protein [Shinella sumterensis]MCD1267061.1 hypothetical protein [Shinella sumterensis]TFE94830.1 hypothetical protein B5M44_22655 [Shinella sumterensis]
MHVPRHIQPAARRQIIEAEIERLISMLDMEDGDCDLEDGFDQEYDAADDREEDPSESGVADLDSLRVFFGYVDDKKPSGG